MSEPGKKSSSVVIQIPTKETPLAHHISAGGIGHSPGRTWPWLARRNITQGPSIRTFWARGDTEGIPPLTTGAMVGLLKHNPTKHDAFKIVALISRLFWMRLTIVQLLPRFSPRPHPHFIQVSSPRSPCRKASLVGPIITNIFSLFTLLTQIGFFFHLSSCPYGTLHYFYIYIKKWSLQSRVGEITNSQI